MKRGMSLFAKISAVRSTPISISDNYAAHTAGIVTGAGIATKTNQLTNYPLSCTIKQSRNIKQETNVAKIAWHY